ncbi:hypothetical protein ACROYT_G042949 [Oculina patagonica]
MSSYQNAAGRSVTPSTPEYMEAKSSDFPSQYISIHSSSTPHEKTRNKPEKPRQRTGNKGNGAAGETRWAGDKKRERHGAQARDERPRAPGNRNARAQVEQQRGEPERTRRTEEDERTRKKRKNETTPRNEQKRGEEEPRKKASGIVKGPNLIK